MLRQIVKTSLTRRPHHLFRRAFLSDAYQCQDAWQARLSTPVLAKVNHDSLYFELEQKIHQKQKISAIDVDIYANKLTDDSHMEEVADLMYKFRLTEETSRALDSTQHAVVRNYIEHSHYGELIELLNNRVGYGLFLDTFTANLMLNRLITTNEFKWAARVATLLGLQEDFSDPISKSLALYACYRYVKGGEIDHFDDLVPEAPPAAASAGQSKPKKKDEIKVRVKYLRNEFFDDHFDLVDSRLLLGKTFYILGLNSGGVIGDSCTLFGLGLYGKYAQATEFIRSRKDLNASREMVGLLQTCLEKVEAKEDEGYAKLLEAVTGLEGSAKLNDDSFEKLLIEQINKSVAAHEGKQIEEQKKIYSHWCELRQQRLEEELERLQRAKRIQELEKVNREMESEEQKLWFFENEDKIDLQIDGKKVYYPKRWFGKKKKPRQVDEGYIPPEVRQRGQQ